MPTQTPTLLDIRTAAQRLAEAHAAVLAIGARFNDAVNAAVQPIYKAHEAALDGAAAERAAAEAALDDLLIAAPGLFVKPRSLAVNGVRCGYRKEEDSVDWPDDVELIARIRALKPELAALLIRTAESIVIDAIAGLDADDRQALGIRYVTGADRRFITVGDGDVAKLAQLVIAAAISRQGEDDKPRAKKGKAKVKVAA